MKNKLLFTTIFLSLTNGITVSADTNKMKHDHAAMEQSTGHDPHFLDMMSEHHKDGIKMAEMAVEKAESKEIKSVASKIAKDQRKELQQMQEWRKKQFSSVPKTDEKPPKMDMSKLEESKGKEFDKQFAMMMAKHHEDGIKMAEEAIPSLKNDQIKKFAQIATKNQSKEKDLLHKLHTGLDQKSSTGTGSSI